MKKFFAACAILSFSFAASAVASVSHDGFCPQKVYHVAQVTHVYDIGHLPGTIFLVTGTDEDDAGKSIAFRWRNWRHGDHLANADNGEHWKLKEGVRFVYEEGYSLSAENTCEQVYGPKLFGILR